MNEIEKLRQEVQRRADAASPQLLEMVYDMLYSRHLSGYAQDCHCSYCSGLPEYVAAKIKYRRLKSRLWKYDFDSPEVPFLTTLKNRYEELAAQHRIDSELNGAFRPPRVRRRERRKRKPSVMIDGKAVLICRAVEVNGRPPFATWYKERKDGYDLPYNYEQSEVNSKLQKDLDSYLDDLPQAGFR